ncbi:hypothetical protein Sfum_1524 [Syntrophobacter fumaroxidans MPOB]|uniref:Uncharacterized protein n=1 Tax=Syntrophobacter fumaroxidans (strain DSM 10017 / MPOB) TaxID=335543 RepID=A0LIG0_SYNFM|nr:hypothetical protein Sfum_1524 [Syntrophobacter fumaroxidans MPOB]
MSSEPARPSGIAVPEWNVRSFIRRLGHPDGGIPKTSCLPGALPCFRISGAAGRDNRIWRDRICVSDSCGAMPLTGSCGW